jgi:tRNA-modifying protein YgfZ
MQPATTTLAPMSAEWRAFLAHAGAKFDEDRVLHYGNPEAERRSAANGDIIADLSHLAILRAEGADAQSFLQGQLSNDILLVSETGAQLSAYCNAKGRMFAIFLIFRRPDDGYYLQLPATVAEPTLKRLRMFILRAKVKLEFAETGFGRIGLSGPNAENLLKNALGNNLLANPYDSMTRDDISVIRLPGRHARFELLAPLARLTPLWQTLSARTTPVGAGPWSWLDIMAGIPAILPGTVEEFVPQMTNLELVGGVSFTKGCYPGQEIVARMHYLGRLKQRMFLAHVESALPPQPGAPVFAPDLPGQSTGSVLLAQPAPEGGHDLLAVVHLSSRETGELRLQTSDGPRLILENLPYPLTATENAP